MSRFGLKTDMALADVVARIDRRLEKVGLAESVASKKAGMSDSAIRNMRRAVRAGKATSPTARTLERLAPVLRTTAAWLLEETGPEEFNGERTATIAAKLISWVAAGTLTQPDVPIGPEELEYAPTVYGSDLDPNGDWIALRVDGDSMNRISPHDSIIFVDRRDRRLVHNACYVIGDGEGGATYKRFRQPSTWEPVSTNPAHKPLVLREGREADIIGRVRKTVLSM